MRSAGDDGKEKEKRCCEPRNQFGLFTRKVTSGTCISHCKRSGNEVYSYGPLRRRYVSVRPPEHRRRISIETSQ